MAHTLTHSDLRRIAIDLANIGATKALSHFGHVAVTRKLDNTPVTIADHEAQAAIFNELARRHPSHAVFGEEETVQPQRHERIADAEYCWLVDPLDGTRNFARGVRIFGTSVAVTHKGRPVAGAIHDATSGVVYSASLEEGAFKDDAPMRLTTRTADADTTIAISSFRRRPVPPAVRGWMDRYLFRNHGAVALHLAWVAAGLVDAAFAVDCKPWDIAAGALIVEQAGGTASNHQGGPLWPMDLENYHGQDVPILAASSTMHQALMTTMSRES